MEILEGDIVNGGIAIKISLDGANWANVKMISLLGIDSLMDLGQIAI